MGVVRVDDDLLDEVKQWIQENGNKYSYPTVSSFVNNAIYNKLKEMKKMEE